MRVTFELADVLSPVLSARSPAEPGDNLVLGVPWKML